jgi:hypothetical protein
MNIDLEHLDKTTISQLLCVSLKSIDNYTKDKDNPLPFQTVGSIKEYNWNLVLPWWIARKMPKSTFFASTEIEVAKLQAVNLQNQKLQLEVDLIEGRTLEASDVARVWSNALVDIKQSLRNVGHIAATDIIDGMTYNKKKKVIDTLIFQNLKTVIEKVEDDSIEVPANETS